MTIRKTSAACAAGHSIGTHTQNHPLSMNRMPIERAQQEIDDGIASATAALGDPAALAPFMRIPGLLRAKDVEDYLASKGHSGLERGFSGRRLAAHLGRSRLSARDQPDRGQGQRHFAVARYPGADGRRAAQNSAYAEGARLSHRPRGAGHAGLAENPDRAAGLAVASDLGNGRDLALAESAELQLCKYRCPPRPGDLGFGSARRQAGAFARGLRPLTAFRARRRAAAGRIALASPIAGGCRQCQRHVSRARTELYSRSRKNPPCRSGPSFRCRIRLSKRSSQVEASMKLRI